MRAVVKRSLIAGVTVGSVGLAAAAIVPAFADQEPEPVKVVTASSGKGVAGQYIVTLRLGTKTKVKAAAYNALSDSFDTALKGFTAKLNAKQLKTLQNDPDVVAIEQDQIVTLPKEQVASTSAVTQTGATWGIDRIDQRALPLNQKYVYNNTGSGVPVYVIDTGIYAAHKQFGGRAGVAKDFVGDGRNGRDCNGHGTHVAGTIAGSTYGVAKKATIRAVRVLNCNGSAYVSTIIKGIDWVRKNHKPNAVANMSLGTTVKSDALNLAARNLSRAGVFTVVAAGNENKSACNVSPASATSVEAVGATTSGDARASFSNYGKCVDIMAPGQDITSAWIDSTTATEVLSGTSMASPHVAGVVALYRQTHKNASFTTVQNWLHSNATPGKVTDIGSGTPNRLLFKAGL